MQRLILSTALCAALVLPATAGFAQTTTASDPMAITAPEGFERQDMVLTADNLLNARIYDATGNSVGEIDDLVLASTGSPAGDSTTVTATPTTPMTTETAPETTAPDASGTDTNTAADSTADPTTAPADGTATSDTATTGTDTTGSDTAGTGTTATDNTATDNTATGTTGTDTTATNDTGATVSTAPATTGSSDGAAIDGGATTGEISHAIVDVGGFLGMGEHRVALPVADLEIYKSDNETRVYLPWTEEQLRALPAYVAGDLSTLGQPMTHSN